MSKKKRNVEIKVKNVDFPNKSTGEYDGQEIRFKGGIKGQKVEVKLGRKRKNHRLGKLLQVLEDSPLEKEKGCLHAGICGGCTYQKLSYENELEIKEEQIQSLFEKKDLGDIEFQSIEGSPNVKAYRNNMEYTFGDEYKDGPLSLGMHKKGRFYEIVNVDDCNIVEKDFTLIRQEVLKYFQEKKTPKYHKKRHKGVLRHLSVRKALSTGEILVNLVTSSQEVLNMEEFKNKLLGIEEIQGEIVGILHTINDGLGDVIKADELKLIYGRDYIVEEILDLKFKISPFSFFQTNTFGAEKLYSIVREFVGEGRNKLVFDLYSGTGTIAQILSPVCEKVIGIEIVEEAVEMARENGNLNNLDNVEFIAGDVFEEVDNLNEKPDLIIIDPPRDGIHPKAINKIIDFKPERFIYVSCNPVTLTRDLKIFQEEGYEVKKVKPMDMFPRTPHVEVVTLLTRNEVSCK